MSVAKVLRKPRSSLLDDCQLLDGRLAWPVAQAAGLSEATFRARLKAGLSPDAAVSTPVAKRRLSRTAEHAARKSASLRPGSEQRVSAADSYSGVIWQENDVRLIVSPRPGAGL